MALIAAGLLIGLVLGLAQGGRLRRLRGLRFRWTPAGVIAVGAVLAAESGRIDAPEILLATGLVCGALFAFANVHLRGLGVVGIGLMANLVPLLFHGTVPTDLDALLAVDAVDAATVAALDAPADLHLDGGRRIADDDALFATLGDRIPVPGLGLVVSFGDLIAMMGMGAAGRNGVHHRRRRGTIPVREILVDERTTGASDAASARAGHEPARRQRPIEVERDRPVPVPLGWGPSKDDERLVGAIRRAHHPTMRVGRG